MQTQEIRIDQAVYELDRVYAETGTVQDLLRKKLEADAALIDTKKKKAV